MQLLLRKFRTMKVIIESGATKSDWRIISPDGLQVAEFKAEGTNVSTMPMNAIKCILTESLSTVAAEYKDVDGIYLYTAGVLTDVIVSELKEIIGDIFPGVPCDVQTDLIGAARAACGHKAGIAAILGTGSNSCQYDGEKIVRRVYSSGFILGDEGSAATLGKLFISDFLKGLVPESISREFSECYPSDYATIVENVYRNAGSPSAYLGAFAPFILGHYDNPYVKKLVDDNFRNFIRRSVKQYEYDKYPVGVVGGFGFALKDIFMRIAAEEGISVSHFHKQPIDGLIKYHTQE